MRNAGIVRKMLAVPKVKKADAKKMKESHAETLSRYTKREKLGL